MSEYIKREDAKHLFLNHLGNHFPLSFKEQIVEKAFEEVPPSADVVEVRHGKWSHDYIKDGIEYNDWFNLHCSVCGETQREAWGKWNYCPYCGARMDGKEQKHE